MTDLLLVLTSIALLDSLSMVPIAVVPLALMLNGRRALLTSSAFVLGIFCVYFGAGIPLMFGLDALFAYLDPILANALAAPTDGALLVQFCIGLVMVGFGWKLATARESHGSRGAEAGVGPAEAWLLGATLVVIGLPGALPYFGAIEQILRHNANMPTAIAALGFYNVVFVLPHLAMIGIRFAFPTHCERLFTALQAFAERWGKRLVIVILLGFGVVFVADAIGWWLGTPLLPVPEPVPESS